MTGTSTTSALEQYAQTLQAGHRAKAQLKRSVQAHQAAIGRLSAAELELQSAKQKAIDELQAHFKQLKQTLQQRYKQTLSLLEQEYDLQHLPITSTTQLLQSSIAALEQAVDRLYLGLQHRSPAKSVQQYTATMQEVSSVMQKAQAAVQHSQDQTAAVTQHTFTSVQHFKHLRVTSRAVSSPVQTDTSCDAASISSLDTASVCINPVYGTHARPWAAPCLEHRVCQSQLRSHKQDGSGLEVPLHLFQHPPSRQHMVEHSSRSSARHSGMRHHVYERHDIQHTSTTRHQGRHQQHERQLISLPDSWHNAPPPSRQRHAGSVAVDFSQHSNRQQRAAGPPAVNGYNTRSRGLDTTVGEVWRHQPQHGQQYGQWSQQSVPVQPPPETAQPGPAAGVAAGTSDTASWMHSLPGSSVLLPAPAPSTPAAVDSVNMSNVDSQVAACCDGMDGAAAGTPYHTVSTIEADTATATAATATNGHLAGGNHSIESSEGQADPLVVKQLCRAAKRMLSKKSPRLGTLGGSTQQQHWGTSCQQPTADDGDMSKG